MKSISVAQAQAFDRLAQEKFGVPSIVLMENAGRSVAEEALKMLGRKKNVTIVCGVGNNGGDGLVAARHLLNAGKKVKVLIVGDKSRLKPDPKANLGILLKMKAKFVRNLPKTNLIIDAVFGIGLKARVSGPHYNVIKRINRAKEPVLSVDVPSGLDADTGKVLGIAVRPKGTVTFVAAKKGMNSRNSGEIIVRDIGMRRG